MKEKLFVLKRYIASIIRAAFYFRNFSTYLSALYKKGEGEVILKTRDGLKIIIRRNIWDARVVAETFLMRAYIKNFRSGEHPIIVDVGGYIGDFSLYAAKYLDARVIVYEPIIENFFILEKNIKINDFSKVIESVCKGVGGGEHENLNISKNGQEIHASSYFYSGGESRKILVVTLEDIFRVHQLEKIDLLKVDVEGGEYDIFEKAPEWVFGRIRHIVFEYHKCGETYLERLAKIICRLEKFNFKVKRVGSIVYAHRCSLNKEKYRDEN